MRPPAASFSVVEGRLREEARRVARGRLQDGLVHGPQDPAYAGRAAMVEVVGHRRGRRDVCRRAQEARGEWSSGRTPDPKGKRPATKLRSTKRECGRATRSYVFWINSIMPLRRSDGSPSRGGITPCDAALRPVITIQTDRGDPVGSVRGIDGRVQGGSSRAGRWHGGKGSRRAMGAGRGQAMGVCAGGRAGWMRRGQG